MKGNQGSLLPSELLSKATHSLGAGWHVSLEMKLHSCLRQAQRQRESPSTCGVQRYSYIEQHLWPRLITMIPSLSYTVIKLIVKINS